MTFKDLRLNDLIGTNHLAKKYVHYDFQNFGLMMAKKLKAEDKKSFYIKLAKYEHRAFLLQALTYALYSKNNVSLEKIFLWKLKELRNAERFRSFIGIFPVSLESINKLILRLKNKEIFSNLNYKTGNLNKLHITLNFFENLPGMLYFPLSILIEKFYTEKKDYFKESIIAHKVRLWHNNSRYYLVIDEFDSNIYRLYYSFNKFVRNSKTKYSYLILKYFNIKRSRFYPHITLLRIKQTHVDSFIQNKTKEYVVIENIQLELKPCITLVTSHFLTNKQNNKRYYSLNYGIGNCWHRENL